MGRLVKKSFQSAFKSAKLTNEPTKDRGGPRQCHNAGDLILHGEAGHADAHIQVGPTEIILEI